jgi:DNA-binding response OmpR family regulator
METIVRVIIVEDDRDLRESLVECLSLAGLDTRGVGSCLEFYRASAEAPFAVAVVDVGLPDQSGYVLAEYIRKNTAMGVIILTARDSVEERIQGYNCGADLYMTKPADSRELTAAITNLALRLRSRAPASGRARAPEAWHLVRQSWRLATPAGATILLTAKEMAFMASLAGNAGKPVMRADLLAALGYRDDEYANRAMDSLVRRLRRKIEDGLRLPAPIKTVHAVGYCFSAPIIIS